MDSVEIAVIGDGILGHWVASDAAMGASVVHIGKLLPGRESSPTLDSGALIRGVDVQTQRGYERYVQLADRAGVNWYHRTGAVTRGDPSLEPCAIGRRTVPVAGDPWIRTADAGWVDVGGVLGTLRGLFASRHGRVVAALATSVRRGPSGMWTIEVDEGDDIKASRVVICAGDASIALAGKFVGLHREPQYRRISYGLFRYDNVDNQLRHCVVNRHGGGWIRPTSRSNTVLCGAYCTDYQRNPPIFGECSAQEAQRIRTVVSQWWPPISKAELVGGRMSFDFRLGPEDRIRYTNDRTLATACGFDGGGFKTAPAISSQILGELGVLQNDWRIRHGMESS